ncbi:HNH endonuclease family protein [Asanoa sp. WMMD1127]|uniref:HNH endonuclease family protein n=1 Tax=Asanoa sp. WMMD1127 TaxID=3016107 RepID=UPI002417DFE3|nr:HNH endonuclease family protein [Asanoa sp. WMMD1127]MDG4822359.1 HNH endonuclease family protein [Asanoa sp. WMMD1127]
MVLLLAGAAGCVPIEPGAPGPSANGTSATQSTRLLDQLTVARAGSMKGYSRDRFPHWRRAGENCDVRDTVLKRDGTGVEGAGCNVVGGRWDSVYDNRVLTDPSDVDIDHMVPLANAWRSGADEWDDKRRGDFANDLDRPQLIAVSLQSNRAKGDQDPSQWKPSRRDFWCEYAQDWIAVKHYWKLTVTSAEKDALADMLETCPWPSQALSSPI